MGFQFGTKKSEIQEPGNYVRNFKKGETKCRFLQEHGDWWGYYEHYLDGKAFPCMEIPECPGCTSSSDSVRRRARRYGTFVYLPDGKRVLPYKIGPKLQERLVVRSERNNGTLLSRDYVVIRTGSGLETDYDVDQDERYDFDVEGAWKSRGDLEIKEILAEQFSAVFGDPDKYLRDLHAEQAQGRSAPVVKQAPKEGSKQDPPFEQDQPDADVEISMDELSKLSRTQLKEIWKQAGFPGFDEDWGKKQIIDNLLTRAS